MKQTLIEEPVKSHVQHCPSTTTITTTTIIIIIMAKYAPQEWEEDQRHGKGTFWVTEDGKPRQQYAGEWKCEGATVVVSVLEWERETRDEREEADGNAGRPSRVLRFTFGFFLCRLSLPSCI